MKQVLDLDVNLILFSSLDSIIRSNVCSDLKMYEMSSYERHNDKQ